MSTFRKIAAGPFLSLRNFISSKILGMFPKVQFEKLHQIFDPIMFCEGKRPSDSVKSARSQIAERTISSKCWFLTHQCRVLKLVSMSNILIYFSFTDYKPYFDIIDFMDFHQSSVKVFGMDSLRISRCFPSFHVVVQSNINKRCIILQLLILAPIFKSSHPFIYL